MDDSRTEYALLSTVEQELLIRQAASWGDALAQYIDEAGLDPETLLGGLDHTPQKHYTVDLYEGSREETVIVMKLEHLDVQAQDPRTLPSE